MGLILSKYGMLNSVHLFYLFMLGIPDEAFIAVDDFETISELVDFILKVNASEVEYEKYFLWKQRLMARDKMIPDSPNGYNMCGLCRKLWQEHNDIQYKSYENVNFWFKTNQCLRETLDQTFKNRKSSDNASEALLF